ncbi:MAG: hypothetical protein WC166_06635 [Bacteroidales bacterium]
MELRIITPKGQLLKSDTDRVSLPGSVCPFVVLSHHGSMISALKEGDIVYLRGTQPHSVAIKSGFVKIENDIIEVCVEL